MLRTWVITLMALLMVSTLGASNYELSKFLYTADITDSKVVWLDDPYLANWNSKTIKVSLDYGRQEQSDLIALSDWSYTVNVSIIGYNADGDVIYSNASEALTVSYTSIGKGDFTDVFLVNGISDLRKVKLTVVSSSSTGSNDIAEDIQLELAIVNETRHNEFETTDNFAGQVLTEGSNNIYYQLHWDYIYGAERYEVEWLFIDEHFENVSGVTVNDLLDAAGVEEAFEKDFYKSRSLMVIDPVNIQTTEQYYNIELVYPEGELYYRVRPIGSLKGTTDDKWHDKFGGWVYSSSTPSYVISTPFEADVHWSSQTVFAEEGKHKLAVSYYDDGMKNRQGVVNSSTDENVLVQSSYYDYEGRPTVSLLPMPINSNDLRYRDNIAMVLDPVTSANVLFQPKHLVQDFGNASTFPLPLTTTQDGVSKYYSSSNGFGSSKNGVNMQYLPDASGYAYTQVQYENDNTGRVTASSGLGPDHKLGEHDVRYYYTNPTSTSLHRLFGSNVGVASHYQTVYTRDPNGQFSVQYLDQEGRTIVTALMGPAPAALEELESNSIEPIVADLTKGNRADETGYAYNVVKKVLNPIEDATYSFEYGLSSLLDDGNTCFNCKYKLEIFILDQDNDYVVLNNITNYSVTSTTKIEDVLNADCTSSTYDYTANGSITFDAVLPVGKFTVYKKLTVINEVEYHPSMADYLHDQYNLPTLTELTEAALAAVNTEPCTTIVDPNSVDLPSEVDYEQSLDDIGPQNCDNMLSQIRQQLSPGGYYYEDDAAALFSDITAKSITLLMEDGSTATSSDFEDPDLWREEWLDLYAKVDDIHPEICHYEACSTLAAINADDYIMDLHLMSTDDFFDTYSSLALLISSDPLVTSTPGLFSGYNFSTALDAELGAPFPYFNGISGTAGIVSGVDLYAVFDPAQNYSGGSSISVPWPGHADAVNPIYAGIDPLDISDTYKSLIINQYTAARMRVVDDAKATKLLCLPIADTDPAYEYRVYRDGSGFTEPYGADVTALSIANCEADAIIVADQWMNLLDANGLIDLNETGTTYVNARNDLRDDLIDYLEARFCSVTTPDIAFINMPVPLPINELRSTSCLTGNVTSLANAITSTATTSSVLGLQPEDLYMAWPDHSTAFTDTFKCWYLDDFTAFTTLEGTYSFPYTSSADLYTFKDVMDVDGSGCATPQLPAHEQTYDRLNLKVELWMQTILDNCSGLSDGVTYSDTEKSKALIKALLTRYALDNDHILNQRLVISADAMNSCYNDTTLPQIDEILRLYGCSLNDAVIINESIVANDCPYLLTCGQQLINALNEKAFTTGTSLIANNYQVLLEPDISDTYPYCFDVDADGDVNMKFESVAANLTTGDPAHHFFTLDGSDTRIYLVDECGNVLELYTGMTISNPTASSQAGDVLANINSEDVIFSGLTAEIEYPSGVTPPCSTIINSLYGYSDPPNKVYIGYVVYDDPNLFIDNAVVEPCTSITTEIIDTDCIDQLNAEAEDVAYAQWRELVNEVMGQYRQDLIQQCFRDKPTELFSMAYQANEYHYTLYYYDQSGSLVQTVPPAGVKPLSTSNTNHFTSGGKYLQGEPEHTMVTQYKYNSFNQVVWQSTPDAGETNYYYNDIGQLRFSENAQQNIDNDLAYTKYDGLGRVTEVGLAVDYSMPSNLNDLSLPANKLDNKDITAMYYNGQFHHPDFEDVNYRNRISSVVRYDDGWEKSLVDGQNKTPHDLAQVVNTNVLNASYYQYDELGNVSTLIQQIEFFEPKLMNYEYDLLSGNVNRVNYQPDEADAFYHAYSYDADNRLTSVRTSRDDIIWEEDARYYYYPHGPLARVELGQDNVQGLDYYYTIQGWLKGINRPYTGDEFRGDTDPDLEMADNPDGVMSYADNLNSLVARDELISILGYYNGDYTAIGDGSVSGNPMRGAMASVMDNMWPVAADGIGGGAVYTAHDAKGLYNGNIAMRYHDITAFWDPLRPAELQPEYGAPRIAAYSYDQLNRLVGVKNSFQKNVTACTDLYGNDPSINNARIPNQLCHNASNTLNTYSGSGYFNNYGGLSDAFASSYSYDANGNLLSLARWDGAGDQFDDLTYNYLLSGGKRFDNRLIKVDDDVAFTTKYTTDIDDGADPLIPSSLTDDHHYLYDNNGRLIADLKESMIITWDAYGKVRSVEKDPWPITNGDNVLLFSYDGMGNRVRKLNSDDGLITTGLATYYVRDASGNIMATYTRTEASLYESSDAEIEHPIYGASRLGQYRSNPTAQAEVTGEITDDATTDIVYLTTTLLNIEIIDDATHTVPEPGDVVKIDGKVYDLIRYIGVGTPYQYYNEKGVEITGWYFIVALKEKCSELTTLWAKGRKDYEIADHLGNVNVAIGDERQGLVDGTELLVDITRAAVDYNGGDVDASALPVLVDIALIDDGAQWNIPDLGTALPYVLDGSTDYTVLLNVKLNLAEDMQWRVVDANNHASVLADMNITVSGEYTLDFTTPATGEVDILLYSNEDRTATIEINKLYIYDNSSDGAADYYHASIRLAQDYYPFGMQLPGRSMSSSYGYRYGFNGMETMDEIYPDKNSYAADFRMLDSRIGRWWSPDPIVKPWESPYAGFANNPIYFVDPSGLDPEDPTTGGGSDNPQHPDNKNNVPDDGEWKKRDANGDIVDENGIFQLPEVTVGGGSGSSGTGTTEPTAKTSQTSKVEKHLYYEARKIGYTKNDMIILSMLDGVTKNAAISNINRGIYRPIYDPGSPYGKRFAENWGSGALAQSDWVKGISKIAGYSITGTLLAAAGGPVVTSMLEGAPLVAVASYQTTVATAEGVMIYAYVHTELLVSSAVAGTMGAMSRLSPWLRRTLGNPRMLPSKDGFLIGGVRFQLHAHRINYYKGAMKGSVQGAVRAWHFNIGDKHIILNPRLWGKVTSKWYNPIK